MTVVELILKAEELNEVVITNMPSIKISKNEKWEQDKLDDEYTLEKMQDYKVDGVYTGTIRKRNEFDANGGMILGLFKRKESQKTVPK
jgi:hypothetical protein